MWSFARGFQAEKIDQHAQLPSFFLILPMILHAETLAVLRSTQTPSGLAKFAAKLGEERERLYSVHQRALALRELTLQSVAVGVTTGLLRIDYTEATVRANELKLPAPPERLKHHIAGAEKLGRWFARLPQNQVFSLMQVEP